jgi:CRP-like cAMP-binding protein
LRPDNGRPANKILGRLPEEEFQRLRPHLRTVSTHRKQIFHRPNEQIQDVIFVNGGVASVTAVMQDGAMVETATIGREGLVGIEAFLGTERSAGETMLQVPDPSHTSAEFLPVAVFRAELDRRGMLFQYVQRYSQALLTLMMQSTACMALHEVQRRCARWLLMTHDRVERDDFQLSQEFLATMLGATRPTVSVVAGNLQRVGLITYKHGRITVLDRAGLEAASCECYASVTAEFDRLEI